VNFGDQEVFTWSADDRHLEVGAVIHAVAPKSGIGTDQWDGRPSLKRPQSVRVGRSMPRVDVRVLCKAGRARQAARW
jgi:hypothetical protein